jgi:hypothetical protein
MFTGQDEIRHYSTVQYMAEPKDISSDVPKDPRPDEEVGGNSDDLYPYNFSQEMQKTATAAGIDIIRGGGYNIQPFSDSYVGPGETEINANIWDSINHYSSPAIVTGTTLYYFIPSWLEKTFSAQSILVRFYLSRIFSVLLGTFLIWLVYLIAKNIGLSPKVSLIMAGIVAFQPKIGFYFANINYDTLLIPLFTLFVLGAVLGLRDGLKWQNLAIMLASVFLAIQTKATGNILLIPFALLMFYLIFQKLLKKPAIWRWGFVLLSFGAFIFLHFFTQICAGRFFSRILSFRAKIFGRKSHPGQIGFVRQNLLGIFRLDQHQHFG